MIEPSFGSRGVRPSNSSSHRGEICRGILTGLIPLVLLAGGIIIAITLTWIARQVFASRGFFVQRRVILIVLIAGLIFATTICIIATLYLMKLVKGYQRKGLLERVKAILITLSFTAMIIILPVLLSIILPQHLAP